MTEVEASKARGTCPCPRCSYLTNGQALMLLALFAAIAGGLIWLLWFLISLVLV